MRWLSVGDLLDMVAKVETGRFSALPKALDDLLALEPLSGRGSIQRGRAVDQTLAGGSTSMATRGRIRSAISVYSGSKSPSATSRVTASAVRDFLVALARAVPAIHPDR